MNDLDRIAILNLAEVWSHKLTTIPGGLVTMRQRMLDAAAGVKGQNYDATRSDRYEAATDSLGTFLARVPNDPTGEAGTDEDKARAALDKMDKLLRRIHQDIADLAGMHDVWCPPLGAKLPLDTGDGPGGDWCSSCWRNAKHCEPAGERYRGLCRWCGDWKAEQGAIPPLPIIKARHRGERITSALVEKHTKRAS